MANFYRISSAGLPWKNTGSWSSTSGGASNGIDEPSSSDAVIFDTNSPATVTVTSAASGASLTWNKASLVITLNGGSITISGLTSNTTQGVTVNKTTSETFTTSGLTVTGGNFTGTAKLILTGGTWTGNTTYYVSNDLDIQGNVTFGSIVKWGGGTFTYVSGTVTTTASTFRVDNGSSTFNSTGITFNNISFFTGTTTLTSNVSCSGTLNVSAIVNATTSETLTSSGGFGQNGNASGTAKIILTGGTWTGGNAVANNIDLQGNVTIGNARYGDGGAALTGGKTLTYLSGSINCTGTMTISGSGTFNTSGVSWNIISAATSSNTLTLTSNLLAASLTLASNGITINKTASETATFTSGMTINSVTSGTAKVILTGGTWSGSNTTGVSNDLDLQGNVTLSGFVRYRTGTLKYQSGTITTSGSTLDITGNCSLDTAGITFDNIRFAGNTVTLVSNFVGTGTASVNGSSGFTINKTTSETFSIGGITQNGHITGTVVEIILTGGTFSVVTPSNPGANLFNVNLRLSGNITFSNILSFGNNSGLSLTYTSGTITTTSSTLYVWNTSTIDTSTVSWSTIIFLNSTQTCTLNSHLNCTTLQIGGTGLSPVSVTFSGSFGWTVSNFVHNGTSALTVTLKESITYTISTLFSCYQSRLGSIVLFTSSHASTKANILMPNNGNNSCNILASFTRIDATGGRTIMTYGGTVTDCTNVVSYTDRKVAGASIVI